jgi:type II secretory pathway component PulF
MALFQYHALTAEGRLMSGTLEAGSPDEARSLLTGMNLTVDSLEKAEKKMPRTLPGRNEFLLFNQQLASLTKAGIPLEQGLRELSQDIASPKMRRLVEEIAADLEAGMSIDQAFAQRQSSFPPLYSRILKAGVETGRLSEMLTSLNRHIEIGRQTRRIIIESMTYPAMVLFFAAIILTAVFRFIIPQFEEILQEMVWGSLNPISTAVFALSRNVLPFWTVVICVVVGVFLLLSGLSSSAGGRRIRETLLLRFPFLGRIYHLGLLGRLSEALAIMVAAGTDMPGAIRLASHATSSERFIQEGELLADRLEQGTPVLEAGQFCRMIPRLFLYSIQLGIQRNELQDNLHSLSAMYTDQAAQGQARLQTILLPLLLILVGSVIAMAVLAIFLPMVQVVTSLSAV